MKNITNPGTQLYTKQIACPEHKGHQATLYCFPHPYAGIWECDIDGTSDNHDCTDFETVISTSISYCHELSDIIDYDEPIEVCTECGITQEDN